MIASQSFAEKSADAVAASMAVLLSTHDQTAPCSVNQIRLDAGMSLNNLHHADTARGARASSMAGVQTCILSWVCWSPTVLTLWP